MNLKISKKSLQQSCSKHCASNLREAHQNSLSDGYLIELKEWVRHVIDEAEKNGDICKRDQFLALNAELFQP
jgi:hypothetical protein